MEREILVQLPVELIDRLGRRARERSTSRSALIRVAVERLVADVIEDDIDQQIIAATHSDLRPVSGVTIRSDP